MSIFRKTIFTGFAPNQTNRDVRTALSFLLLPWKWREWKRGEAIRKAEVWLENYLLVPYAVAFDSGRSGLMAALRALDAGRGYEVLVQAYTCVVVVNAIRASGAAPVFVDMRENFFMDPADAEKKITPRTKVLIIQHTFGIPADIDALMAVAKKYRLRVIEDCAHALGATYRGRYIGTYGDIGMFSFGSDKFVSCVRGGALITKDSKVHERLISIQNELPATAAAVIFQHLSYYPVFWIGKRLYHLGIGKIILWLAKTCGIMSRVMTEKEKREGEMDKRYPTRIPNALARILLDQFEALPDNIRHRKNIARIYRESLGSMPFITPKEYRPFVDYAFVRYPILTKHPALLLAHAKRHGIILGNWYDNVVAPCVGGCKHAGYPQGSCPKAESASRGSVNLPTDITIGEKEAKRIIDCLKRYG